MPTSSAPLRRPRSIFSLERMRSDKRVTWLTIAGILLVPLVIGGLLVWALWNPTERLGDVKAAVVNLDQPVKVGGQTVPLGRQLSAGLLDGTSDNFSWVLTDEKDAASGLADGTYVSVVTIPKDFSEAATSPAGAAADATQATIDVQTSAESKLVDPAISQAVTSTATSVLNKQLTSTYLDNVYVGFNTLHDQIAKASSGAAQLSGGIGTLATGTHQLADAAGQLGTGASGLSSGVSQLSDGASALSSGASQLSTGASSLATGLTKLSGGASALSGGLSTLQSKTQALPAQTKQLSGAISGLGGDLRALQTRCITEGGSAELCGGIAKAAATVNGVPGTAGIAAGAAQLADGMPALTGGIAQSATGASAVASGLTQSAGGASGLASGAAKTASGAAQLADGAAQSADGASQLASGTTQLHDGLTGLAAGADASASGAASLSSGLKQATAQLPSYSKSDRTNLASVASEPVTQKTGDVAAFGESSIPLFGAVALWLGALATFLVLQAVSKRALLTTRASGRIALDGFVPGAVIGAVQGVLIAGIMQFALSLDVGQWFGFAAIAAVAGIAFAAVNQGLVALLGGVGRFVSMLVVVITLASGIISTVPGFFSTAMQWLPTSAAITAFRGVVESTDGVWRGFGGLLLWAAFGFALTLIAVARRRIVRVTQLLPAE
ncbi:YhgE/Pip domain-containing protein [Leifsonia poae]|uniref:ABC-2 type transporter transmembrane domain-containing protein n=1 Tax=Leifsonia poae TaxID=110933 RepID=A0A9W6HCM7_9MICO|nr:YhgE/Pip domain-containing protein [Leifsonia poae]GLJ77643.1 hypothetical protein GCM10017584_32170 [Leifsonia poae]